MLDLNVVRDFPAAHPVRKLIHLFICLFIYIFLCLLIYSFIYLFIYSFIFKIIFMTYHNCYFCMLIIIDCDLLCLCQS